MRAYLATLMATAVVSTAQAQPAPADTLDMKCQTEVCRRESSVVASMVPYHVLPPVRYRQPVPSANLSACYRADNELGIWMSKLNDLVNDHEESRGGTLTQVEASRMRHLIYTETYYIREQLRGQIAWGEVRLCNEFKDRAILVANEVVSRGFGYGPPRVQGPYYRNH